MSAIRILGWCATAVVLPQSLAAQAHRYRWGDSIPPSVVHYAANAVSDVIGAEAFRRWVSFSPRESRPFAANSLTNDRPYQRQAHYLITFRLRMPERPFVDEPINLVVDTLGRLLEGTEVMGAPKCRFDLSRCEFSIDEAMARQIAERAGFERGVQPWKVAFGWDGPSTFHPYDCCPPVEEYTHWGAHLTERREGFAWVLTNVLAQDSVGPIRGKMIAIDPFTGAVLLRRSWGDVIRH